MKMPEINLLEWQKRYGTEKSCATVLVKVRHGIMAFNALYVDSPKHIISTAVNCTSLLIVAIKLLL